MALKDYEEGFPRGTGRARPTAIANQYYDSRSKMTKSVRCRVMLAKSSDFNWLIQDTS